MNQVTQHCSTRGHFYTIQCRRRSTKKCSMTSELVLKWVVSFLYIWLRYGVHSVRLKNMVLFILMGNFERLSTCQLIKILKFQTNVRHLKLKALYNSSFSSKIYCIHIIPFILYKHQVKTNLTPFSFFP